MIKLKLWTIDDEGMKFTPRDSWRLRSGNCSTI